MAVAHINIYPLDIISSSAISLVWPLHVDVYIHVWLYHAACLCHAITRPVKGAQHNNFFVKAEAISLYTYGVAKWTVQKQKGIRSHKQY